MKAVIIGSGVAGLTSAAVLAQMGHAVTVFEQSSQVGGVTASFEQEGYRWDLGQLLLEGFGPGEPVGNILAELGVAEELKIRVDDRDYIFPDFAIHRPEQFGGFKWRIEHLKQIFPEEARGLERYWNDFLRFTSVMTLARRMENTGGLTRLVMTARLYLKLLPFLPKQNWSAQRLMDDYFQSKKLQAVFISILADFFTPPSQFIGLGVFALNPETAYDSRMPKLLAPNCEQIFLYSVYGGIGRLVDALAKKIRAQAGVIQTNLAVTKIVVENNRVTGVVDETGTVTPTDVVMASGGAKETFLKLVGEENLPADFVAQVKQISLMDSVFMVHLGVDFDPSTYVRGVCTYFYGTYDIEGGIEEAHSGLYHQGQLGFVVHVPSLYSPQMAPEGRHAMTIYTICPDQLKDGSWGDRKEEFADQLVAYAEEHIPGLREHTLVRAILTPEDFRKRTHLEHHAFGGIAPLMGAWKVRHLTPIKGLWFVGAQSESGGGVSAVMVAAYKAARKAGINSNG